MLRTLPVVQNAPYPREFTISARRRFILVRGKTKALYHAALVFFLGGGDNESTVVGFESPRGGEGGGTRILFVFLYFKIFAVECSKMQVFSSHTSTSTRIFCI